VATLRKSKDNHSASTKNTPHGFTRTQDKVCHARLANIRLRNSPETAREPLESSRRNPRYDRQTAKNGESTLCYVQIHL
jgi:hypothetical protein